MRLKATAALIGLGVALPLAGRAQTSAGSASPPAASADSALPAGAPSSREAPVVPGRLSDAGVYRAAALVDSVYVDRLNREAFVEGGDFASYLVARLGVRPVPDDLAIAVAVDTGAVTLSGRVADLPEAVKASLGPALAFLDPNSIIAADVALVRARPGVVRFHLRTLLVNGVPLPEALLVPLMSQVGVRYPALTRTGRDLLVAIPEDGTMRLAMGGVQVAIAATGPAKPATP